MTDESATLPDGPQAIEAEPVKKAATRAAPAAKATADKVAAAAGPAVAKTKAAAREAGSKVRAEVNKLKGEATDKAREVATEGKDRATSALDSFAKLIDDAANAVDDRLGDQYGGYARTAADAVAGIASQLRGKEVDELFEDARGFVKKSPALAIGAAAAIGFVFARLVKAGLGEAPAAPPVTEDEYPDTPPIV